MRIYAAWAGLRSPHWCLWFLLSCLGFCGLPALGQQRTISGIVREEGTGQIMAYCNVGFYLEVDKAMGTISGRMNDGPQIAMTDVAGKFRFSIDLKDADGATRHFLVISFAGYITDTVPVVANRNFYEILLRPSISNLQEAIVTTGVSRGVLIRENPVAILSISSKKLDRTVESNVIDALVRNAPGLNAVKTGPNISKPFIRGLGYNRVLTLYDGIRQEGQQWGDEHGIEVDGYNIQRAEVIKGPASLMYGSDAVAGVVQLFSDIPSEKDGKVHGRFVSEYQANNNLIGDGLRLGYSNNHWLWALRGSCRLAANYRNPIDGRVYLTGFEERNASGMLGHTSASGYSYLNVTLYDNLQGIPDGSRDSLSRRFTRQVSETGMDNIKDRPIVPEPDLHSYSLSPLHQHIQHYRVYLKDHYRVGEGTFDATLGFQQNIRREFDHPTDPLQAGLFVRLNTYNYGLRYDCPAIAGFDLSFGINGMYQDNKNKNATDFPIPDYHLWDGGAFLYGHWKKGPWAISGGLRFDDRKIRGGDFYIRTNPANGFDYQLSGPAGVGDSLQFPALRQNFSGLSLSLGATLKLNDLFSLKFNIARGYRSPNITEIASNGLDPGAHIVYLGNRDFVPEFSLQEDIGLLANSRDLDYSVSVFNNDVAHYIYLSQLQDAAGNPVTLVPGNKTFRYQQSAARLYGMEATLDLHPASWRGIRWSNQFSITYGLNTASQFKGKGVEGRYLPLIPAPRLISGLDWAIPCRSRTFTAINIRTDLEYTAPQNRYLGLDDTERPTPGYVLADPGCSTSIHYARGQDLQVLLVVNNVFDVAYQSNLSRLRYFEYYTQSPNGHLGIYNMGRNVCIKIICPF